jgi:hypothetical protein
VLYDFFALAKDKALQQAGFPETESLVLSLVVLTSVVLLRFVCHDDDGKCGNGNTTDMSTIAPLRRAVAAPAGGGELDGGGTY